MFHEGTVDPRKKMTAPEMRSELMQRVQEGEIVEEDVPKEFTIANWITFFYEIRNMQWQFKQLKQQNVL